jgi:hypothetical protein
MGTIIKIPLPVQGQVTSRFGYRKPPKDGASSDHKGIDIAAAYATPIKAPLDGQVVFAGDAGNAGNKMILEHYTNNIHISTEYYHLSRFNAFVGQQVFAGQVIGYTGNTGNSTGPHLHYGMRVNGVWVDPLTYTEIDSDLLKNTGNFMSHAPLERTPVANTKEYNQQITVDDKFIDTIPKFLDKYGIKMSPEEFLNYKDNQKSIYNAYTSKDKAKYGKASIDHLEVGTVVQVPLQKMASGSPYKVNQTLIVDKTFNAFYEREMKQLINNPKYRKINISQSNINVGDFFKKISSLSVWVWSKSASLNGDFLIDITPFIKTINTSVNENGGNFSIQLPHITYKRDGSTFNFDIPITNYFDAGFKYNSFESKNTTHEVAAIPTSFTCDFFDDNQVLQNQHYSKRKNSFFKDLIQPNDLIFIRFEKLEIDKDKYNNGNVDYLKISPSELKDRVFDMIALVDSVRLDADASANRQSVGISGRDLSKLVIDDGVFFFPVEYAVKSGEQIIKNSTKTKNAKRLVITDSTNKQGNYESNLQYNINGAIVGDTRFNFDLTQTIEEWLLFIFSQLTHIDICPDNLFSSYVDKTFVISRDDSTDGAGNAGYKRVLANGIWQIVKLVTEDSIVDRRMADASLSTDTGSLLNLIRKVCQKPFVELTMDTYGNKYYFMVRKPPFSEQAFKTNKCINIFEGDVKSDNLDDCEEVYTWYRLTPMGSIIDVSDGNMMIELPAVLLPEYVEVWGMKVLDIQTNYLDFDMSVSTESSNNLQNIVKQGEDDLDWLIETNAYLPFTRSGSITIKEDRRIKRGMNIRYFPTGEVFYVDGVSQVGNFENTTERMTVLTVSRGITEKHYSKYFNIVNLKRNGRNEHTWTVNKEIFEFLLQRKHRI